MDACHLSPYALRISSVVTGAPLGASSMVLVTVVFRLHSLAFGRFFVPVHRAELIHGSVHCACQYTAFLAFSAVLFLELGFKEYGHYSSACGSAPPAMPILSARWSMCWCNAARSWNTVECGSRYSPLFVL